MQFFGLDILAHTLGSLYKVEKLLLQLRIGQGPRSIGVTGHVDDWRRSRTEGIVESVGRKLGGVSKSSTRPERHRWDRP